MSRTFLKIFIHFLIFSVILIVSFFIGCPIRKIFGIPCPCCGISRAYLSAFKFDFKSAFSYHPLFIIFPFALFFILHKDVFDFHISKKLQNVILILIAFIFIAVYLLRLFILHDNF